MENYLPTPRGSNPRLGNSVAPNSPYFLFNVNNWLTTALADREGQTSSTGYN